MLKIFLFIFRERQEFENLAEGLLISFFRIMWTKMWTTGITFMHSFKTNYTEIKKQKSIINITMIKKSV